MASLELTALTSPVSDADPCGPDLDALGDPDYLNFMAMAEGLIPASFLVASEDSAGKTVQRPFWEHSDERAKIDFAAQLAAAGPLLAKTRDLRLLAILAKFCILDKDLFGFRTCLEAIAVLLGEWWDGLHPRGGDDDFSMRAAVLATLDDPEPVILPLRFYPLLEHKNLGTISYRSYAAASADKAAQGAIERALRQDADLGDLIRIRDALEGIQGTLTRIGSICTERLGVGTVKLEALPRLVGQIGSRLEEVIVIRDPTAASASSKAATAEAKGEESGASSAAAACPSGRLATTEEAVSALAAASDYFSRSEPSNPALLLVRQAQALIGKSFFEAMQLLIPTHVETASLHFGSEVAFNLPLTLLASSSSGSVTPPLDAEPASSAPIDGLACQVEKAGLAANSRQEAVALLEQVGAYFRAVEPSSPIPLLTERACALTGKDFMALLGDVLPKPQ